MLYECFITALFGGCLAFENTRAAFFLPQVTPTLFACD